MKPNLCRRPFAAIAMLCLVAPAVRGESWPSWRGPRGDGTSAEKGVPIHWSATSNIIWQTELPGSGHASPIVWKDRIFTIAADLAKESRLLVCLERGSGKLLWAKPALSSPLEKKHSLNSFASSTPATDGTQVYCSFLDGREMWVGAYDLQGTQIWAKRPGVFSSMHGFCSSPILFRDLVIMNGDHDGDSYILALSRKTGETVWKTSRENRTRSYCAPLLREISGRMQLILSGDKSVASYDPSNGRRIWFMDGPTDQFVASPVYSPTENLVFITGGYPDHHILAIDPGGNGNVTASHIRWRTTKGAAYVPSPIVEGNYFLIVSDSGVSHCFEAKTGKLWWQERLGEQHASLVSANGLVYFLNDEGIMNVIKPGPEFERVAQNPLGEGCFASPAISDGQIFIRGEKHLFCVGKGE